MKPRPIDELKNYSIIEWMNLALIVLIVLCLGLISVNKFLHYRYDVYLIQAPCKLCTDANPKLELVLKPEYQINNNPLIPSVEIEQVKLND